MVTKQVGGKRSGAQRIGARDASGGQQTYDLTHGGRRWMELGWIGGLEQEERKGERQTEATEREKVLRARRRMGRSWVERSGAGDRASVGVWRLLCCAPPAASTPSRDRGPGPAQCGMAPFPGSGCPSRDRPRHGA